MKARLGIIEGDGIGPEIIAQAKRVLDKVALVYGHTFEYVDIDMGGCSIDKYGTSLTDENLELAKGTDAILLGAVGGDTSNKAWYGIEPHKRPEAGLLKIRKELGLFANLRPVYLYKSLASRLYTFKLFAGNTCKYGSTISRSFFGFHQINLKLHNIGTHLPP